MSKSSLTIAHLTDAHLGPIAGFTPQYWNAKRLMGFVNWHRTRRSAYRRLVLNRIVSDMRHQQPDHIAVTGDLTNIGLPREHINALYWLESLGRPEEVTVVPGNHDIYSRLGSDPGTRRWAAYMSSNAEGAGYAPADAFFPFVRLLGRVALVGVNSAVPTPPLIASGYVGAGQLAALATTLDRLGHDGFFRFLLIHHPPLPGQAGRWRGLRDADELQSVLMRHGAELVIHGHNHLNSVTICACANGPLSVVGAPSASLGREFKGEPLARYNLYRLEGPPWTVELIGRGLTGPDAEIAELERRQLMHRAHT